MDFHSNDPGNDPGIGRFEEFLDHGAEGLADAVVCGLSGGVAEALADPIVLALMAADGVDRNTLEALLCRMAARLGARESLV